MNEMTLKLFAGNANPTLAREMADHLKISLGDCMVQRFRDGEVATYIDESVRGCDVYILQPTCPKVNDNLMELLVMIDAMRRSSARQITAVVPYYGYARQERKSKPRDPISAKLVANLITAAGADRIICMDLHAKAIEGFFDIPMEHLSAMPILANYYKKKQFNDDVVVVSPDIGGVIRARDLAGRLHCGIAIIDKRRPKPGEAEIMNIIGDIKDKACIMVDDIIDSAGTICLGADAILNRGAKEIHVCCTHALFSGPAVERLTHSKIKEVVVTNTIPQRSPAVLENEKFKILSVGSLLGEAIRSVNNNLSVSRLFE
ncbi:MAG TPA: ribose-phosphate pyrophosphokinase [Clostridiales bacterium]|nr:ribose-phosphate pyrophosphokinase [Clostridiales bacterium]